MTNQKNLLIAASALSLTAFSIIPEIEIYGALFKFMHEGDVSAKVALNKFSDKPHFYGLGALENLKGEIMVLDGKPFISKVTDKGVGVEESWDYKAALFVGTTVKKWDNEGIPMRIITMNDLQNFVKEQANRRGIDTTEAFPFMVTGMFKEVSWHVISWKDGDTEHTHEKHINSGAQDTKFDATGRIIGFYSPKHHRIFTHHSTNMHMHIKMDEPAIAGHVDNITFDGKGLLFLPLDFVKQ